MHYSFKTTWKFKAHANDLWQEIDNPETWPLWWKGFKNVSLVKKNLLDVTVGYLLYKLSFKATLTKSLKDKTMEVDVNGDLIGKGKIIVQGDNNNTTIQFTWNVVTTKKWMLIMEKVAYPLFGLAHSLVMHWGAVGLAKHKQVQLLTSKSIRV